MKINSELPLTLMSLNEELNEYDFVLFHLYKQYPEYREYYKNMRLTNPTRMMIFDNSAYEFFVKGETLDVREYIDAIIDLKPDIYIMPDVLMDRNKTLDMTLDFLHHEPEIIRGYRDSHGHRFPGAMAVAQGNSTDDLFDCLLRYRELKINFVALPFHNSFYKENYDIAVEDELAKATGQYNEDIKYAAGRIKFTQESRLLLKKFSYVHLLGSHCVYEKKLHDEFIKSIDTGYPVKCGIAGYKLFEEPEKPNIIIDDFMTTELSEQQKQLIKNNVETFRMI